MECRGCGCSSGGNFDIGREPCIATGVYVSGSKSTEPWEELSKLSVPMSVTTFGNSMRELTSQIRGQRLFFSWKQLVRPFSLGLVGLAITVALSGFGYKLSRYHRHPALPLQATVVKLWIEPPNASITAASRLKDQLHLVSSPQALANSIPSLPWLDRAVRYKPCVHRGCVLSFDLPIPLRSPPPQYPRTA
jgi:hypothetical protein